MSTIGAAAQYRGFGVFRKTGTSTWTLTGTTAATTLWTISAGTLKGTTTSLQGNVTNNANVIFDQSVDGTYTDVMSGTGTLTKSGTGTLTLSGNNTYSGGTTINGGTLKLGASERLNDNGAVTVTNGTFDLNDFNETIGSLSGSGSVTLGSGTLTTGGNDASTTYAGVMSGSGVLYKKGTGKLTLTGANTYTGDTNVYSGVLDVSGTIGDVHISSGATLCGTGSVGDVSNYGTMAPGNSIGTLIINGNYIHQAGSTYEVEVDANGNSDLINVIGTATINGGTVDVRAESGSYAMSTDYTILQAAGGVTGTFDTVTSNLAFLDPSLIYNASSVILTLTRNSTDFASVGKTSNERAVGDALDRLFPTATGDMTTVLNTLIGLSAPDARAAFNQMGGATFTALARTGSTRVVRSFRKIGKIARVSSTFRGATFRPGVRAGENQFAMADGITMTDGGPLFSSLGGGLQSPPDTRWNMWVAGNGTSGKEKGDDIAARYKYTINGISAGLDTPVTDRLIAGISFGVSSTDISYYELTDSAENESIQGALYGFYDHDPWYIDGVLLYGKNDYETDRHLSFGGINRTAHADYDGSEIGGSIEAGYRIERKPLTLEPCASLELSRLSQNSFTETGADSLNLVVDPQETRSVRSSIGLRVSRQINPQDGITLKPEASLHWAHEFSGDDNMVNTRFSGSSAGSYTIRGEKPDRNSAICELGVTGNIQESLSLSVHLDAEAGSNHRAVAATAKIAYRW